jgi:hypothetical protein
MSIYSHCVLLLVSSRHILAQPFYVYAWRGSHGILKCIIPSLNVKGEFTKGGEANAIRKLLNLGASIGDIERILVVSK